MDGFLTVSCISSQMWNLRSIIMWTPMIHVTKAWTKTNVWVWSHPDLNCNFFGAQSEALPSKTNRTWTQQLDIFSNSQFNEQLVAPKFSRRNRKMVHQWRGVSAMDGEGLTVIFQNHAMDVKRQQVFPYLAICFWEMLYPGLVLQFYRFSSVTWNWLHSWKGEGVIWTLRCHNPGPSLGFVDLSTSLPWLGVFGEEKDGIWDGICMNLLCLWPFPLVTF